MLLKTRAEELFMCLSVSWSIEAHGSETRIKIFVIQQLDIWWNMLRKFSKQNFF